MRILLALGACFFLVACDGDTDVAPLAPANCGAGTTLDSESQTCVPTLGEGIEVDTEGTIIYVVDENAETVEAAYERGLEEGRASVQERVCGEGTETNEDGDCVPSEAFQTALREEGAASVIPLNCAEGTDTNEAGDACVPTEAFQDALRAEGAASVTPLNCGDGTEVNEAGDACVPTEAFQNALRAEGAASVTPLNCAEGTIVNAEGIACVPSLSDSVEVDEESGEIRPTDAALAAARQGGVDSVIPLNCALGTVANAAGDACVPNLGGDVETNAETGEIRPTDAALAAARQGGVDSVIPLNCAEGTTENAAGDACIPNMAEDVALNVESGALVCAEDVLAAAREDGRQAGVASVDITTDNAEAIEAAMPNCAWDTEVWDGATETCVCADDAALRDCSGVCGGDDASCEGCDGVQNSGLVVDVCGVCGGDDTSCEGCDGVPNSGLVLDACGVCDGPGLNEEGCCGDQLMACDGQCVDELSEDLECLNGLTMLCARALEGVRCNLSGGPRMPIGLISMMNPGVAESYQTCLDTEGDEELCYNRTVYGVDEVVCPEGWAFRFHDLMRGDEEAFMQMRMACPNQLVNSVMCTPETQTYTCYGKTCGGFVPDANSCNGFVCETADEVCAVDGSGRDLNITCQEGTTCFASSVDNGTIRCLDGAECTGGTGTGDDWLILECESGSTCHGSASTGDARTIMNCAAGATCDCRASTGDSQCIMNCDERANCTCERSVGNSRCVWN